MFGLEKHSKIFGEPRTGAHAHRVLDIAIVDLLLTHIVALIIAIIFKQNFFVVSACLLGLSIIMHRIFGVRTKVDTILFK